MKAAYTALLAVFAACTPAETDTAAGTDSTTDPAPVVERFADGVVSSALPEFATTFTPSGDTVFFNRTPADRSRLDLFYAVRTADGWAEPAVYEPLRDVPAIDPFVDAGTGRLYVSTNLPMEENSGEEFNLWWVSLENPEAGPVALPYPINSDSSDVFNSIADDGTMVFSSRRDGERYVYEVHRADDGWGVPRRLVLGDGTPASNPAIHPSGDLLVFARRAPNGFSDLHLACRQGDGWGDPTLLPAPVNTEFTEFAPGFGGDHLYFTSERPGVVGPVEEGERPPGDIYRVGREFLESFCR